MTLPSRDDALAIVHEHTASDSLRKHMLAVEAAMRAYAERFGEDPERWGLAGLLHDFDYERWPNAERSATEEHPSWGVRLLRERGYPEDVLAAILGHAARPMAAEVAFLTAAAVHERAERAQLEGSGQAPAHWRNARDWWERFLDASAQAHSPFPAREPHARALLARCRQFTAK